MTTEIFVLDRQTRDQSSNRDWKSIIPAPFVPNVLDSYNDFNPTFDALVIIHLSDFRSRSGNDELESSLATLLGGANCLRLLISGSGSSHPIVRGNGREYVCGVPVHYPTDPVFSSRLAIFLAHLTELPSGANPPWNLIEPDAIPEHLVAIYLLSLATAQNQTIDFMRFSKGLDEAKVEFKALGGTNEVFLASDTNSFSEIAIRPDVRDAIRHVLQSN